MTSIPAAAPPRHLAPIRSMRIALLSSADASAHAIEVGRRLVQEGHRVVLSGDHVGEHLGVRCIGAGRGRLRTHLTAARSQDVAFVFGTGLAPLIPLLRTGGTAVALRMDALEDEERADARRLGRYRRAAERIAVREADALVAGSRALQDGLEDAFGVQSELIGSGAAILRHVPTDLLEGAGLVPGMFHLVVEDAAHPADAVVAAHAHSAARLPLVVLGRTGDPADRRVRTVAAGADPRLVDQLHAHALSYVHDRAVGGGEAPLLAAMGAGTPVLVRDAKVNREAAGTGGLYFDGTEQLGRQLAEVERYPLRFAELGELMQARARSRHDWDQVAEAYERLAAKLTRGYSTRGMSTGRRLDAGGSLRA